MPIYIPLLRLTMVFLNIYDTFKTLKLPYNHNNNNTSAKTGQPSTRAMVQRKRDMKGCLAVWIVWCCLTSYERLLEGILSIFIPFYSELKALVLVFLILTRARGAEPIYLHIIRPFLKPYASTLDLILEIAHFVGEVFLLVFSFPVSLWGGLRRKLGVGGAGAEGEGDSSEEEQEQERARYPTHLAVGAGRGHPRSVSAQQPRPFLADANHRRASAGVAHPHPQRSQPPPRTHEIWYPPASSYEGLPAEDPPVYNFASYPQHHQQPVQPHHQTTHPQEPNAETNTALKEEEPDLDLEWRTYPPFPSAYPATPLVPKAPLPLPLSTRKQERAPLAGVSSVSLSSTLNLYPVIPESEEDLTYPEGDFQKSLSHGHSLPNPGYGGLSDDFDYEEGRVRSLSTTSSGGESGYVSEGGEMELDEEGFEGGFEGGFGEGDWEGGEDKFNITLRTPPPPAGGFISPGRFSQHTRTRHLHQHQQLHPFRVDANANANGNGNTNTDANTNTNANAGYLIINPPSRTSSISSTLDTFPDPSANPSPISLRTPLTEDAEDAEGERDGGSVLGKRRSLSASDDEFDDSEGDGDGEGEGEGGVSRRGGGVKSRGGGAVSAVSSASSASGGAVSPTPPPAEHPKAEAETEQGGEKEPRTHTRTRTQKRRKLIAPPPPPILPLHPTNPTKVPKKANGGRVSAGGNIKSRERQNVNAISSRSAVLVGKEDGEGEGEGEVSLPTRGRGRGKT